MPYCTTTTDFITQSCNLFKLHPDRTRYTVKYRSAQKQYVFKVTDDYTAVKLSLNRVDNIKDIQLIHTVLLQLCIEKEIDDTVIEKLIYNASTVTQPTHNDNTQKQNKKQQQGGSGNKKKGKK